MNQAIFNFLFSFTHQRPWLDWLTIFVARDLIWLWIVVLVLVAILFYQRHHTWRAIIFTATTAIVSWTASELLKWVFASNRPFVNLPTGSTLLTLGPGGDAFPSSHAAFLFALALAVYFYNRTLGKISLVIAVLVSLARIATGLHWPIDVFGGFILALIVCLVLRSIDRRKYN